MRTRMCCPSAHSGHCVSASVHLCGQQGCLTDSLREFACSWVALVRCGRTEAVPMSASACSHPHASACRGSRRPRPCAAEALHGAARAVAGHLGRPRGRARPRRPGRAPPGALTVRASRSDIKSFILPCRLQMEMHPKGSSHIHSARLLHMLVSKGRACHAYWLCIFPDWVPVSQRGQGLGEPFGRQQQLRGLCAPAGAHAAHLHCACGGCL